MGMEKDENGNFLAPKFDTIVENVLTGDREFTNIDNIDDVKSE
jgi:hypothetical protein